MEGKILTLLHDLRAKRTHLDFLLTGKVETSWTKDFYPFFEDLDKLTVEFILAIGNKATIETQGKVELDSLTSTRRHTAYTSARECVDLFNGMMAGIRGLKVTKPLSYAKASSKIEGLGADVKSAVLAVEAFASAALASKADEATPEAPEAGTLVVNDADSSSDSDEGFVPVLTKRRKKAAKKGKKKAEAPYVPLPAVELKPTELEYARSAEWTTTDVGSTDEDFRFAARSYKIRYFYTPEQKAPYIGDRKVKFAALSVADKQKVEWKPVVPEMLYRFSDCDPDFLKAMSADGFFPSAILEDAITHSIPLVNMISEPKGIPQFEWDSLDRHAVYTAESIYWWGQIEKLLRANSKSAKLPFVNKWAVRLLSLPDTIEPAVPTVLKKLYGILRFNIKEDAAINRTFRGFVTGMLASWKAGDQRSEYLSKAASSVNCYWGEHATNYVELWTSQDWNPDGAKPRPNSIIERTFKKLKSASKRVVEQSEAIVNGGREVAAATYKSLEEDVTAIQDATESLSSWAKAKSYAKFFGGRVAEHFARHVKEQDVHYTDEHGRRIHFIGHGAGYITMGILRSTIGMPFYTLVDTEVTDEDGKTTIIRRCQRRRWWQAAFESIENFGGSAENELADGAYTPWFYRGPLRLTSATYGIAKWSCKFVYSEVKGLFEQDTPKEAEARRARFIEENGSAPTARWVKGLLESFTYAIASGGTIMATGIGLIPGAFIFAGASATIGSGLSKVHDWWVGKESDLEKEALKEAARVRSEAKGSFTPPVPPSLQAKEKGPVPLFDTKPTEIEGVREVTLRDIISTPKPANSATIGIAQPFYSPPSTSALRPPVINPYIPARIDDSDEEDGDISLTPPPPAVFVMNKPIVPQSPSDKSTSTNVEVQEAAPASAEASPEAPAVASAAPTGSQAPAGQESPPALAPASAIVPPPPAAGPRPSKPPAGSKRASVRKDPSYYEMALRNAARDADMA